MSQLEHTDSDNTEASSIPLDLSQDSNAIFMKLNQISRLSPLVSAVISKPGVDDIDFMSGALAKIMSLHKESVLLSYQSILMRSPETAKDLHEFIVPVASMLGEIWKKSINPFDIKSSDVVNFISILCETPSAKESHPDTPIDFNIERHLMYANSVSQLMSVPLEISTFNQARRRLFIGDLDMPAFMSAIRSQFEKNVMSVSQGLNEHFNIKQSDEQFFTLKSIVDSLTTVYRDAFEFEFIKMKGEFKKMTTESRKEYQEALSKHPEGILIERVNKVISTSIAILYPDMNFTFEPPLK